MAISSIKPQFTETDRYFLELIGSLILESENPCCSLPNSSCCNIPISDNEADIICELISDYQNNYMFSRKLKFIESLSDPSREFDAEKIYFEELKRQGRGTIHRSNKWGDFLRRFGRPTITSPYTKRMSLAKFKEMERTLFEASGMHPVVVDLLIQQISLAELEIEAVRDGRFLFHKGEILEQILKLKDDLQAKPHPLRSISAAKASGLATLIADCGVLFTSRDWGVAGTISTMAGALLLGIRDDH